MLLFLHRSFGQETAVERVLEALPPECREEGRPAPPDAIEDAAAGAR